tara:strand:- start:90 stop:269 length:180 start_codon:yes stop_codon:yes gene_type:complete
MDKLYFKQQLERIENELNFEITTVQALELAQLVKNKDPVDFKNEITAFIHFEKERGNDA